MHSGCFLFLRTGKIHKFAVSLGLEFVSPFKTAKAPKSKI